MELPDEFTSFWHAIVNPGEVCRVEVPSTIECFLTSACVGQEGTRPAEGRLLLSCKVNSGKEHVIVPFRLNTYESATIDLRFNETDVILFKVTGVSLPVHISGYIKGGFHIVVNEYDENTYYKMIGAKV